MIRNLSIRHLVSVVFVFFAVGCAGVDGSGQTDVGQNDDDLQGEHVVDVAKAGSATGADLLAADAPSAHPNTRFGPHPDPWTGGPEDPSGPHPDPWAQSSRPAPAPTPDPK